MTLSSETLNSIDLFARSLMGKFESRITNRITTSFTNSDTDIPSSKLVKDSLDGKSNTDHTHNQYLTQHQSLDSKTVTIEKQNVADSGYTDTYVVKQGGTALSPKINISGGSGNQSHSASTIIDENADTYTSIGSLQSTSTQQDINQAINDRISNLVISGSGSGSIIVDVAMDEASTNPVQNKVIANNLNYIFNELNKEDLVVYPEKKIIQNGDIIKLIASYFSRQSKNGKSISFVENTNTLQTETVDGSNNASINFTATGFGTHSIYATDGTLSSDECEIEDCVFFDEGTLGTPNRNYYKNSSSLTYIKESDGLSISNTDSSTKYLCALPTGGTSSSLGGVRQFMGDTLISLDVLSYTGGSLQCYTQYGNSMGRAFSNWGTPPFTVEFKIVDGICYRKSENTNEWIEFGPTDNQYGIRLGFETNTFAKIKNLKILPLSPPVSPLFYVKSTTNISSSENVSVDLDSNNQGYSCSTPSTTTDNQYVYIMNDVGDDYYRTPLDSDWTIKFYVKSSGAVSFILQNSSIGNRTFAKLDTNDQYNVWNVVKLVYDSDTKVVTPYLNDIEITDYIYTITGTQGLNPRIVDFNKDMDCIFRNFIIYTE